ncbi:MAG: tRNA (N6-isopentenyl adenosine(37)-C2)-methylthiotransferase MiaB [Bacteroidota bacterium]|nr:tRNA (N6-isopentenyl adenosine(37)-C2)-methylthiotransferase MiaB [Bacteroidota bacterium]
METAKTINTENKKTLIPKGKVYIETYGCQMNFSDSEIAKSILVKNNYQLTENINEADTILINTCSIRENAEQRIFKKVENIKYLKNNNSELKIGILGCMTEHLKSKIFELNSEIDFLAGPDSYRNLHNIIDSSKENKSKALDIELDINETYDDIIPLHSESSISAFISIMRGCDNFCSYCVVPYTRGRERSRSPETILKEIKILINQGIKEITLLGQNVNSYKWKNHSGYILSFPSLLEKIANETPELRIRFSTSHPKDISRELIEVMAKKDNICKHIHLAVQSGSSRILKLMNRKYSRESFLEKIEMAKQLIPDIGLTTDIITGFCTETEDDHKETLSLMKDVKFDWAFMFAYSERSGTVAAKNLDDNIDNKKKKQRLKEIIELQSKHSLESNKKDIGKTFEILVEGFSKKSDKMLKGRNSQNKMIVFPAKNFAKGDLIKVKITDCTSATLIGE